jgi:hypothetical protein
VPDFAKIFLTQPEEGRAIHFGVAPDVIVNSRMERATVPVVPGFLRLVFRVHEDRERIPILAFPRQIIAALEEEDALAGGSEPMRERAPARAAANDDEIVMLGQMLPRWAIATIFRTLVLTF